MKKLVYLLLVVLLCVSIPLCACAEAVQSPGSAAPSGDGGDGLLWAVVLAAAAAAIIIVIVISKKKQKK